VDGATETERAGGSERERALGLPGDDPVLLSRLFEAAEGLSHCH